MLKPSPTPASKSAATLLIWLTVGVLCLRLVTSGVGPLLDPSESRYAEIGREMVVSGNWVVPRLNPEQEFLGKPPLHTWLTAACLAWLGPSEFAARLPSFVALVAVLAMTYLLAWHWFGAVVAGWAAITLASMSLVWATAALSITDMVLAACMTGFMVAIAFAQDQDSRRKRYAFTYLAFASLGLALLAKGPVAVALAGLAIALWWLFSVDRGRVWRLPWITGGLLAIAVAAPWYGMAEARSPGFLRYFLWNENVLRFLFHEYGDRYGVGHTYPPGTICGMAFLAMLPWSPLLAVAAWRGLRGNRERRESRWRLEPRTALLLAWGISPLVMFTPARNIVVTYVLPGLPALGILTGRCLATWLTEPRTHPTLYRSAIVVPAALLLIGAAVAVVVSPDIEVSLGQQALALVGLVSVMALLGVPALRTAPGLAVFACLAVPCLEGVVRVTMLRDVDTRHSAKRTLQRIADDARLADRPLAFYRETYSAEFYTGGTATSLDKDMDRVREFLGAHRRGLVVFSRKDWRRIGDHPPELRVAKVLGPVVVIASTAGANRRSAQPGGAGSGKTANPNGR